MKQKIYTIIIIAVLLTSMAILMVTSSRGDSATTDESTHIVSGYLANKYGDLRANPEHPFLGKKLAAIPLLFLGLNIDKTHDYFKVASDFYYDSWRESRDLGNKFFYTMGNNADSILQFARIVPMISALILGLIIFYAGYKFYGWLAAVFSLLWYAYDPTILAHAKLANTDLWLTLFFFLSVISFGAYLAKPNWKRLIIAGICFGLAQGVKFSAITLTPILIVIWLIKYIFYDHKFNLKKIKSHLLLMKKGLQIFIILFTIGYLVIWATYGFSTEQIPQYRQINDSNYYNQSLINDQSIIKYLQPSQFWKGLTFVFSNSFGSRPAYLLGDFDYGGWWYYFPIAFLVKTPLPTLIFIFCTIVYFIKCRSKVAFKDWLLLTPIIIYLLISITSKLNIGIRHLMPIYPFIFLLIGKVISEILSGRKNFMSGFSFRFAGFSLPNKLKFVIPKLLIGVLIIWYIIGTVRIYPHFLSYFNEFIGPENGIKVLADSNIDWGQDLKRLKTWIDENKITEPILLEYFWDGEEAPTYYGINWQRLKSNNPQQKGYIATGVGSIEQPEFSWLKKYEPFAHIGYSINIYKIE